MNAPEFWAVRHEFMERHGVTYAGVDEPAPDDPAERTAQSRHNLEVAIGVLRAAADTVDAISDRLVEVAETVPERVAGFHLGGRGAEIFDDPRWTDVHAYPASMWKAPGEKVANRAALSSWGAWVNATAKADYDRPLFIVCSADLAESTNIAGFSKGWEDLPGWGWYERSSNPRGALLPQQITEFTNSGLRRAGFGERRRRPDGFVQWVLGGVLDLRLVLLPEVRTDAPLLAAGPGLPAQGRQGHLGRRPLGPRDGRGLADPLRDLRDRGDPAVP
jgi:hypothetical protein